MAKFRCMDDTVNPSPKVVNHFSPCSGKISPLGFGRLRPAVGKRKPQKIVEDDRTPLQIRAAEVVERNTAQGWTKAEIQRRSESRRRKVATSTINSIIRGHDPSIKTLEKFALAYDEDPVELFRLNLDDPPEPNEFAASPVYRIFSLYQSIMKSGSELDKLRANERIEEAVDFLRKLEKASNK